MLVGGTEIVLSGGTTSSATLSGGVENISSGGIASGTLTVTDGTRTAHLALLGQYTVTDFITAADGQGGTLITDPPFSTGAEIAARR